jgi:hypothetical protein
LCNNNNYSCIRPVALLPMTTTRLLWLSLDSKTLLLQNLEGGGATPPGDGGAADEVHQPMLAVVQ